MIKLQRFDDNPILLPSSNEWEGKGAFNASVIEDTGLFHMVYRALSTVQEHEGHDMQVSTIGYAVSSDGLHFKNHTQLITPEFPWELYGCEDPRIVKVGERFFIFYTALSLYPFSADGIKVAVAITKDFKTIDEKHLVTPFNAKAMTLFPEKINGKLVGILTVNTDRPPAKIGIAYFDSEEEIWNQEYWDGWYQYLDDHIIPLQRNGSDQVEVGAGPIKTSQGWLFIHSYIRNYMNPSTRIFGIEAVFLDEKNPQKITGRINEPLLTPQTSYEALGNVPHIVFPSGALIKGDILFVYYGAADTVSGVASAPMKDILKQSCSPHTITLERFVENPIIRPITMHAWEAKATFNPAAFFSHGKIHIIYRAMSMDNTSVFGYATTTDGFHIDERLPEPIYTPREEFEKKKHPGNSGCEDPRITKIDDIFYMCYTAYDGSNPPRVALTQIAKNDFLERTWNWKKPILISPPGIDDKDACVFPKKIQNKYVFLHRIRTSIWLDFVDDLSFSSQHYLGGRIILEPREFEWDNGKIGITAPPIETEKGWLLLYHGVSNPQYYYKVGAVLFDLENPAKVLSQTNFPIFEPEMKYEREGQVPNVVFPCGIVVRERELFVYYGGADTVVGVATIGLDRLLKELV